MTAPIEQVLITALLDAAVISDITHAGKKWPDDLEDRLPFVAARRVGGPRGALNDYPVVDIDAFASSYAALDDFSEAIDRALNGPARVKSVVIDERRYVLDEVFGNKAFSELPWDGDEARYGAVYAFTVRLH